MIDTSESRNAHNISVEEPTRNSPLGRPRRRLEADTKMDPQQQIQLAV
jgi:hypothetical protein